MVKTPKGWRFIGESATLKFKFWESTKGKQFPAKSFIQTIRKEEIWGVVITTKDMSKKIPTKNRLQAEQIAIRYMRSHPNG